MSYIVMDDKVIGVTNEYYYDQNAAVSWDGEIDTENMTTSAAKVRNIIPESIAMRIEAQIATFRGSKNDAAFFSFVERRRHQGAMEQKEDKQRVELEARINEAKLKYKEKEKQCRLAQDELKILVREGGELRELWRKEWRKLNFREGNKS